MRAPLVLILLIASLASGARVEAQVAPGSKPGSELTIYVMTMGPGSLVWERFGHNAIWVHDAARGTDKAYNYGLFDFAQENFILRFIQGRMLYWMEGFDAYLTAEVYERENRSVWVQELNLSPADRVRLRDFLEWNELEENRYYRYDYYRDNCSTRVRDAIDLVLGGQIRERTASTPSGSTYRSHTRRLTSNDVPVYTGLMMGLGSPVDREISEWEEMFLPLALRDHLREMTILDESGNEVPLVRSERTLYESTRPPVRDAPPLWWPAYLAAGLLIAGLLVLFGRTSPRSAAARYGFGVMAGLWSVLAGSGGLILLGLWALTDHTAAYRNENLFQLNPLSLAVLVLVPVVVYGSRRWERAAVAIAVLVAALSVLGLLLKVLPGFSQVNFEVIALALPVHAAIAWVAWHTVRTRRAPAQASAVR